MVMMKRQWLHRVLAGAGLLVLTSASAGAQVVQVSRGDARNAIGFTLGGFFPYGFESRPREDVLVQDLSSADFPHYLFEIDDFHHFTFGGEYLFGITENLEVGASVGFYSKGVDSIYADVVHPNQTEIEQRLKLRIIPITATLRFLPLPRGSAVEPYVGAGVGIFPWKYSEVGEFVESNFDILSGDFRASGTAVGPVIVFGARFPIGDTLAVGAEGRWQQARGDTGGIDEGFLGDKIDLSGWAASATVHFRF
jgi:opacity protein-like surface antigen